MINIQNALAKPGFKPLDKKQKNISDSSFERKINAD